MFEDCGENSPFPPHKDSYHSSGWDEIMDHSFIQMFGKFVSKDFVVPLPNFIFLHRESLLLRWQSFIIFEFFQQIINSGEFSKRNCQGFLLFAHWLQHKAESWILSTVAEDLLVFFWTNRGKLGDSPGLVWVVVLGLVDWLGEDFISRVCAKQFVEKLSRIRISKNPTF